MEIWRRMIRIPRSVAALIEGQLSIYKSQLHALKSDLCHTQALADGSVVWLVDEDNPNGVSVPRDNYVVALEKNIAEVVAHIAELGGTV